MANIPPPSALQSEKKFAYDVMRHGAGNAWEDRGSKGVLAAFFITCFATLFRPHIVCDQMRRPETTGDASAFTIGCGIFWSIAWAANAALDYHRRMAGHEARFDEQSTAYIVATVVQFIAAPVILCLFVRVGSVIFYKLIAGEMEHKFNQSLAYNVLAYCMGPSILAAIVALPAACCGYFFQTPPDVLSVIPIAGIFLALVWSIIAMMVAAKSRLYLRAKTVIICTLITYTAGVVAIAIGYFVVWTIWFRVIIKLYVLPQLD